MSEDNSSPELPSPDLGAQETARQLSENMNAPEVVGGGGDSSPAVAPAASGLRKSDVFFPPLLERPEYGGHWKWGAGILMFAVVVQLLLAAIYWEDPTGFKISFLFVWPATSLAITIWWLFFSGFEASLRYTVLGAIWACLFLAVISLRIDGSDGDMMPQLAWRWSPNPWKEASAFLARQPNNPSGDQSVKSTEIPTQNWEVTGDDWPAFRGPRRDGICRAENVRLNWETNPPRLLWKHPIGEGWSSFAVIGDYGFTQEQRDDNECVVCYDLNTGDQRWIHVDLKVSFQAVLTQGGPGPRATPTFDSGKIYTVGATGQLNCLDAANGEKIWARNILEDAETTNAEWGTAGSPWIEGDIVLVNPGGKGKAIIAYDKRNGEIRWAGGSHSSGYGSPRVETVQGESIILMFQAAGLSGHSLVDGQQLWLFPWTTMAKVNAIQPIVLNESSIVCGAGYGTGTFRLNVTRTASGEWDVTPRWKTNKLKPKFNDLVSKDKYIFGLDGTALVCLDADSGRTLWKQGRYGFGQLLLIDSRLFVLTETGEGVLLRASADPPTELARFQALPDGTTWNHPVIARGKLIVRNSLWVACYDVKIPRPVANGTVPGKPTAPAGPSDLIAP